MGLITYIRRKVADRKRRAFIKEVMRVYQKDGGLATFNGKPIKPRDIDRLNDGELKRVVLHDAAFKVSIR